MNWQSLIIATALLSAGWFTRGWHEDSNRLAAERAQQGALSAAMRKESVTAKAVEDKLQELKANERVITKEIPKVIVRDVYRNVCLDTDGLQLIERARTGNSTKPTR